MLLTFDRGRCYWHSMFFGFFFCMFRVHKGQGCMMGSHGRSLISNIYKTHMSHRCHLEREGNFNANTGAFLKDVDINHQAVTGSVRDDWRGQHGLAISKMTARCMNTALGRLENQTCSRRSSRVQKQKQNHSDNRENPLITVMNVSALFVFLFFCPLWLHGFLPPNFKVCQCTYNCDISCEAQSCGSNPSTPYWSKVPTRHSSN